MKIQGSGILQGFGSADPVSTENFFDTEHATFNGRALAVIRPTGTGDITIIASAEGCDDAEMTVEVK